jgi:hypothetical protein
MVQQKQLCEHQCCGVQTKKIFRIQIVWKIQIQAQVFDDELGKNAGKKNKKI